MEQTHIHGVIFGFNIDSATDFDALADILCIYIIYSLILISVCGGMSLVSSGATLDKLVELPGWVQPGRSNFYN